jgi:hypothetical protein
LSDTDAGAVLGMTPETVRHYGKRAQAYMIAQGGRQKDQRGKVLRLVGENPAASQKKSSE